MQPVAIFRHYPTEGPGYFATFLERYDIPWQLVAIDEGAAVPEDARAFSGLAFMGGPMSVNDDLPWIPKTLQLIRDAVAADIPVIGHCLGGQLLSKALGGTVSASPAREIGWGPVSVVPSATAQSWFGDAREFQAFHWHGETFSIPPGATRILASPVCAHQAYTLGKHLGMQCHVEMTTEMIASWCESGAAELARHKAVPSVQAAAAIHQQTATRLPDLHRMADRLYQQWIKGLIRHTPENR